MAFPFLDREQELARLRRALAASEGSLVCVYGRRRLGKSRLLVEALAGTRSVYFVGDERDAPLHRAALAREAASLVPRFDEVTYPSWEALLDRWWSDAPAGAVLALDEFPFLVTASPELPSLIQRRVDRRGQPARHVVLCGSSQRMMMGLLLDAAAPLYGRARELFRLEPLPVSWLADALKLRDPVAVVEHYAVWGGVPRYWELSAGYRDLWEGVKDLVLDPLGVLHREPERLLLDELTDIARPASILSLVGQGCHRLSEIAGRLGIPATSLSRPLAKLVELGFIQREIPFGTAERNAKRSGYRLRDPFLRFWYGYVEPNRSRLAAGQVETVRDDIQRRWPHHVGGVWEDLARESVARIPVGGGQWKPAGRWWGPGSDRRPLELDIVAESATDPGHLLVGEAKLSCRAAEIAGRLADLERRAMACPLARGKRVTTALWVLRTDARRRPALLRAADVVTRT